MSCSKSPRPESSTGFDLDEILTPQGLMVRADSPARDRPHSSPVTFRAANRVSHIETTTDTKIVGRLRGAETALGAGLRDVLGDVLSPESDRLFCEPHAGVPLVPVHQRGIPWVGVGYPGSERFPHLR